MERKSELFEGFSSLERTYTTGITASSDLYYCGSYDRIIVYVDVTTVTTSGIVAVYCDFSPDGSNSYRSEIYEPSQQEGGMEPAYRLTAVRKYALHFPNAGKHFRIRIEYVSGTSLVIGTVSAEAKT